MGLLRDTSVTIRGLLRDNLGLLRTTRVLVAGDYMGITCRISWGQLGDDFGTTSGHIGHNQGTSRGQPGTTWDLIGEYMELTCGISWGLLGDNLMTPWTILDLLLDL